MLIPRVFQNSHPWIFLKLKLAPDELADRSRMFSTRNRENTTLEPLLKQLFPALHQLGPAQLQALVHVQLTRFVDHY
jgi:hypothetical protein